MVEVNLLTAVTRPKYFVETTSSCLIQTAPRIGLYNHEKRLKNMSESRIHQLFCKIHALNDGRFEVESMRAAANDYMFFEDGLSEDTWPEYEDKFPQRERRLRQAIRKRYRNTAFHGVSESFIGWDAFRDQLYARIPTVPSKAILNTLRRYGDTRMQQYADSLTHCRLRIQGTYGDENGLLLPWVERRKRKEHRTRAHVKLFTVKTPKPQATKSQPAVDIDAIGHSVSSQSPSTHPSASLAQTSRPNDNSGANMANEPTQA